jgi:hypothetical protein
MHSEYRTKIDNLRWAIKGHKYAMDLTKIWRTVNAKYTELDKEYVICRRRNKPTPKYEELAKELDALILALEKRISWASLL